MKKNKSREFSEIRVPFTSIEDVMRAYPNWQLKMMSGNDVHFQYKAIQVYPGI